MQKPQLVAVDTNILFRLSDGHEPTIDAWQLITRRLKPVQFVVPPTVLAELAYKAQDPTDPKSRELAAKALHELRPRWHMQPADFNALQDALAANAAQSLRDSALVPYEERNDALLVGEAAVLECLLLVSRDSHLLEIDHEALSLVLARLDLVAPVIASPEKLLNKFYK